jgi:hypothetical protein
MTGAAQRPAGDDIYYTIRRDLRRCISPLCGGWFISRVNKKQTRCADGSRANECYVAEIQ